MVVGSAGSLRWWPARNGRRRAPTRGQLSPKVLVSQVTQSPTAAGIYMPLSPARILYTRDAGSGGASPPTPRGSSR